MTGLLDYTMVMLGCSLVMLESNQDLLGCRKDLLVNSLDSVESLLEMLAHKLVRLDCSWATLLHVQGWVCMDWMGQVIQGNQAEGTRLDCSPG